MTTPGSHGAFPDTIAAPSLHALTLSLTNNLVETVGQRPLQR